MSIIRQIITIILTNKRHKAYENRLAITQTRGASIGTPIKPENDFSPMFHGF